MTSGLCPAPGPEDPLVRSLIGVVDCNVASLVHGGYATLFAPSGGFAVLLTSLLTIYVAILGYQLLLGRAQLRIGNLALTALKIGVVLALTTGWSTYQTVVYEFLFRGPAQLADAMLAGVQPQGSLFRGDVFDGLQSVFDALNAFSAQFAKNSPAVALPGAPGGAGFGAQALTASAVTLLLSSLGVLLAAKIVLGLLLAFGPIFIALLLFATTRGLFEGWLRATVAFAFAALAATVILGVALTVLEPSLLRLQENIAQNDYSLGPVYSILVLVIVFAAVSAGTMLAGGTIALGFRLPRSADRLAPEALAAIPSFAAPAMAAVASRADRVAAATAALERRESAIFAQAGGTDDRRSSITMTERGRGGARDFVGSAAETRLGQAPRRGATPRTRRTDAGSGR